MKKSVRWRFTGAFVLVLLAGFLVSVLVNEFFLPNYYFRRQQEALVSAYETLEGLASAPGVGDSQKKMQMGFQIRDLYERYNISSVVLKVGGREQYAVYANDSAELLEKLNLYLTLSLRGGTYPAGSEVLDTAENYQLLTAVEAETQSTYMECWGTLPGSDQYFLMSVPLEGMHESIAVTNRFYTYVGAVSLLAGAFYMFFATKRLVTPLQKLTVISQKMAGLDFSEKYEGEEQDEIGVLGKNINHMSGVLEETISQLQAANQKLQKDIEEKIQIDDMRKEFLGNVSHELKTPLALIQGYAEGLQDCVQNDPEGREFYCSVILEETEKMTQMVKKLLNLNQLEFGNDTLSCERFDLCSVIRGVLQSGGMLAKGRELSAVFEEQEAVWVWADEFMIEEVISNYISNAIHHLDEAGRLEVSLERFEDRVKVSVFNSGLPIPEEDLDKVWIKFYKVDKARTRAYGGSGIGLSIVKAIMDSHGQECGVYNRPEGVVFWFTVALAE